MTRQADLFDPPRWRITDADGGRHKVLWFGDRVCAIGPMSVIMLNAGFAAQCALDAMKQTA